MRNVREMIIIVLGMLVLLDVAGCSSKPVYEKMSVNYVVHLDLRHEAGHSTKHYKSTDVRDENMDLIDSALNRELRSQMQSDEEIQ